MQSNMESSKTSIYVSKHKNLGKIQVLLWVANLSNCNALIDGKHICMRCLHSTGSSYFNYKGYFSNTLSLCSSFNVRDQASHPYRTTGKIIVLYILIFTFLGSSREDKKLYSVSFERPLIKFQWWYTFAHIEIIIQNPNSKKMFSRKCWQIWSVFWGKCDIRPGQESSFMKLAAPLKYVWS
jgi:hypothetical protein